jgi:hypothetical protein
VPVHAAVDVLSNVVMTRRHGSVAGGVLGEEPLEGVVDGLGGGADELGVVASIQAVGSSGSSGRKSVTPSTPSLLGTRKFEVSVLQAGTGVWTS